MNRRKLLSLATLSTLVWGITPLLAKSNTDPWKAKNSAEAIKLLYPNKEIFKSDKIYIKIPKFIETGYSIPINIKTDIEAKKIILLKDTNFRALIGIADIAKDSLVDYTFRIDMLASYFYVLIENYEGQLYQHSIFMDIPSPSCGG